MIISKTPMRMSFAGGGSDMRAYYAQGHGAVVSTAIDKSMYIAINKRFTHHIRVGYSTTEYVDRLEDIQHNLVRESLKATGITNGVDIVYMSDMLPAHEGSGLGASSSILVGTLHALYAFKGTYVSPETLARQACGIEIDILGHPIGKQDQYAAAYGGFNFIRFNADESVDVIPIICKSSTKKELNDNLLVFYTNLKSSSKDILPEQKRNTPKQRDVMDKMVELAHQMKEALEQNDLTEFGSILHQNWIHKKKMASRISNPIIDKHYAAAMDAGALGGKVLGSGGGGFLIFYAEPEKQDKVRAALSSLQETPFHFEPDGSRIIYVHD